MYITLLWGLFYFYGISLFQHFACIEAEFQTMILSIGKFDLSIFLYPVLLAMVSLTLELGKFISSWYFEVISVTLQIDYLK